MNDQVQTIHVTNPSSEEEASSIDEPSTTPECLVCLDFEHSSDRKPAVPCGGTCNDRFHVCSTCERKWLQINTHYHLWQLVSGEQEWQGFLRQATLDDANPEQDEW